MDLSRLAYTAYTNALGDKVPEVPKAGDPFPSFDELPAEIKSAWDATAQTVKREINQAKERG